MRTVAVVRWSVMALVMAAAAAFLAAGGWRVFVGVGPNYCTMTYMSARYLPVAVPNSPHADKYTLSLYREANQRLPLEGQPVLFIPGNAGSGSQVRSLGAEAYRLQRGRTHKGADLFTAHFNEELSAFDGRLLTDQVEHVIHCIDAVLQAYREGNYSGVPPTSVVLVGHSMGGFVARALFVHPAFQPGTVDTIITLNTPHRLMPLLLHRSVADLYHKVNGFWRQQFNLTHHFRLNSSWDTFPPTPSMADVTVLSIAGSFRDSLVRSDLASLETLVPISHGLSLLTTSVPGVRLEADHQSILWCNQLVKTLANALLELSDLQVAHPGPVPVAERMRLFGRYFISPIPYRLGYSLPQERWSNPPYLGTAPLDGVGMKPKEALTPEDMHPRPSLRLRADNQSLPHIFNISHWRERSLDSFVLIAPQSPKDLRVTLYPADEGAAAVSAANLSFVARQYGDDDIFVRGKANWQASSSPPSQKELTLLYLSREQLGSFSYLAVEPPGAASAASKSLFGQFIRPQQAALNIPLPNYGFTSRAELPRGHAALVNVTLSGVDHRIPLLLSLSAENGSAADWAPVMFGLMPHMSEELMVTADLSRVPIKFHGAMEPQPLHLLFFVDPECSYQIEVGYDYLGIMEQMLKYHLISGIPAYFFVFLLVLAALARRYAAGSSMDVGEVWRDHTFRMSCLLFAALPLFEAIWATTTSDTHFQSLYSFIGAAFRRLPGPLGEHSFVDFDVAAPPLSLYPFLYAFGSLLFLTYFVLIRTALFIISTFFRVALWLGGVLPCRRNRLQPGGDASSAGQATTTAAQTECDAEAQERRQLSTLGVVYLLLLAVGVGLTLGLHSFLGLLSTTLVLGFSTAWQTARAKRAVPPLTGAKAYERDALFSYQTMILIACIATLSAMAPLFVSWVKSLPGHTLVWRTGDGYELLSLILIVITAFASHPFQRGYASFILWLMAYGAAGVVVCYCLVPVYRLQDVALVYSLLVFLHLQKQRHTDTASPVKNDLSKNE